MSNQNIQQTKTTEELLKQYDQLLFWVSIIFTIFLIFIYYFSEQIFAIFGTQTITFVQNLIVEFLPIGVTFIISYSVLGKYRK